MFPKLCVECVHFQPNHDVMVDDALRLGFCGRSAKLMNPVTGKERHRFCETEREMDSQTACGPTGQFWQLALTDDD